jgi:hypothetical protein
MNLAASLLALAASVVALVAADSSAIEQTVTRIYQPYVIERATAPVWERSLFSREVSALINHWQRVMPEGQLDGLNDGDWLCQCQDWSPLNFHVTTLSRQPAGPGTVETRLRIDLGNGQSRQARLLLHKEAQGWRIDDLFADDFPHGLKQALRETIAADEKVSK